MADSKKVLEGENLELYCDVEGNGLTDWPSHPRTEVHWTMDRAEDGLLIRVKGYPEPVITWKFNDQILNPYVHNITKKGQVLTISKGKGQSMTSFDPK